MSIILYSISYTKAIDPQTVAGAAGYRPAYIAGTLNIDCRSIAIGPTGLFQYFTEKVRKICSAFMVCRL